MAAKRNVIFKLIDGRDFYQMNRICYNFQNFCFFGILSNNGIVFQIYKKPVTIVFFPCNNVSTYLIIRMVSKVLQNQWSMMVYLYTVWTFGKARKKANVKYLDRQLTLLDVNKSINKLYFSSCNWLIWLWDFCFIS